METGHATNPELGTERAVNGLSAPDPLSSIWVPKVSLLRADAVCVCAITLCRYLLAIVNMSQGWLSSKSLIPADLEND